MVIGVKIFENDGFVSITATGGETSLAFDFPIYDEDHIKVIRTRSGTKTTLTITTDYTVPAGSINEEAGGTVTLTSAALAGDVYTLLLNVPYERTTDFSQAGDFFADTLNLQLDLITQQNQQIVRDLGKAAKLPETSTLTDLELPDPQANYFIGWNTTADGLVNYSPATGVDLVSAAMQPVTAASTLALARAAMGVDSAPFSDANALVKGSADATKLFRIEVDGNTAGTTRVMTVPDADFTAVGTSTPQVLTGKTIAGGSNAISGITSAMLSTGAPSWDTSGNLTATSLLATGATGGFGIKTASGVGGTVVQATSKSTGVTLNKLSGQIQMNAASLAANTTVSFTVTNSTAAPADVVIANRAAGGTSGAYQVWSEEITAGSFKICVRNTTAGALAETLFVSFIVVKGAHD